MTIYAENICTCRINRNIVECKSHCCYFFNIDVLCINRNIVECKYTGRNGQTEGTYVLIETLWNVNSSAITLPSWPDGGINRNIVECKLDLHSICSSGWLGINRNIVECKFSTSFSPPFLPCIVLIETLWNVNQSTMQ